MLHKYVEPITVVSVETENDKTVVIGNGGLIFFRETHEFRHMPEVGELYYLTSVGNRIISMQKDGGDYLFCYSEADLKAQDQALIDSIKKEKENQ